MIKIVNARKVMLKNEDFQRLAEIEEHPRVARWDIPAFGGDVKKASAGFQKSLEGLSERRDEFIIAKACGKIVGFAGIHRLKGEIGEMEHVGEIGIAVHPDFQRLGAGTKLLDACIKLARKHGFKRLEGDTRADNAAMRRILERTGFKLEGIRRRRIKINGKYHDEACYAYLIAF